MGQDYGECTDKIIDPNTAGWKSSSEPMWTETSGGHGPPPPFATYMLLGICEFLRILFVSSKIVIFYMMYIILILLLAFFPLLDEKGRN